MNHSRDALSMALHACSIVEDHGDDGEIDWEGKKQMRNVARSGWRN